MRYQLSLTLTSTRKYPEVADKHIRQQYFLVNMFIRGHPDHIMFSEKGTVGLPVKIQKKLSPGVHMAMNTIMCVLTSVFCVDAQRSGSATNKIPAVFRLDEGTLLKIFGFLPVKDLLRASQVCTLWYRLSYDRLLWGAVDLRRFSKSFDDPENFNSHAVKRLAGNIQCLDLSGFNLSEENLAALATQCKGLRVLKLKSVTFSTDPRKKCKETRGGQSTVLFPKHLHYLDIRFSHGNPKVYRAIGKELGNIKWLGLCDAFFRSTLAAGELQTAIDSLKHLRKLDLSHCLLLKDSTLVHFARCRHLEVLSVRRCSFLTGSFVEVFLDSCTKLKTLILDGISLDDEALRKITWNCSSLKHLELGWCSFITPKGLKSALPQIARIQTLEYLGLCAIGEEKALDDEILLKLGTSLACWGCKKLKSLNVSRSQSLTPDGVIAFKKLGTSVEMLDTTDCPGMEINAAKFSKKNDKNQNDQVFVQSNHPTEICGEEVSRNRKGSVSATQFARSKYILETPL